MQKLPDEVTILVVDAVTNFNRLSAADKLNNDGEIWTASRDEQHASDE